MIAVRSPPRNVRELSPEPEHLYVSSRRVVLAVIKALSRNLLWAVFEPNDSRLRRRIKDSLEGFFQALLARGLTAGGRPAEAYYVKVDESLDGPEVREAGQLLAEIGIAVTRPAEFIVLAVKRRPEIVTLVEEET
jgi:phage tail sheath protein FI